MECYYLKNKQICPLHPILSEHGEYEKFILDKRVRNERNRIGKFDEDDKGIHVPLQPIVLGGKLYYHNTNSNNIFNSEKKFIGDFDKQMNQIRVIDDNREDED